MEYLKKGHVDAFGRTWTDSEVDYVNDKIDFLNMCKKAHPNMVDTAKVILASSMLNPSPKITPMCG